ncbi:MAG: YiiD C-terminal domain-containing protein [Pseudomonadales bacterium]|nr:YiiD C-terminal domain-containing protein [Pseudomonadales bacterium]
MHNIDSVHSLEKALHDLIPISQAMGISVVHYDGTLLRLKAPLSNNINHQQTAFGGSLFSIAALSGWGLIQLKLAELNIQANTVIAGGNVSYSKPVSKDLICECRLESSYQSFVTRLQTTGKASLILQPEIILADENAMSFSGKFVVKQL